MLSTIDRRAVLAGIVTASAIAAPTAVAASAAEPDPVYALIEDHRRAVAWLNEICRKSLLPDFCDPEDREVNLANDTLRNAGDALLFAPITTIAGAASLLSYCVEVSHMEVCDGDLGTWREGPTFCRGDESPATPEPDAWHTHLHRNLAKVLQKLATV